MVYSYLRSNLYRLVKYLCIGFGLIIFLFHYFFELGNFLSTGNDGFYLSLEMVTDSAYLPIILNKSLLFQEGINFFFLPFIIEKQILSLLGFNYVWITLIFYKLISILLLILGFYSIYNYKKELTKVLLVSIFIGLLFCFDYPPFNDRYPRPAFSNIFFFYLFLNNIYLVTRKKMNHLNIIIMSLFHCFLAFANPWQAVLIGIMTTYSFLETKKYKKLFLFFSWLSIFFLPLVLFFLINSDESFHSHYLGLKKIEGSFLFILDFYIASIISKQVLLSILLIVISSIWLKNLYVLKVLTLCFILLPVPFALLGYTLQSYHLLIVFKSFLILLLINQAIAVYSNKDIKFIFQTLLISIFFGTLVLDNSWIDRAEQKRNIWNSYTQIFEFANKFPKNCYLITNDNDLRSYWSNFQKGNIFPTDGFIRTSNIEETLREVKLAIKLLDERKKLSSEEKDNLLIFSTHNFFASTRSTSAPSMPFESIEQQKKYNLLRKDVDNMQAWAIDIPEFILSKIDNLVADESRKLKNNYFTINVFEKNGKKHFEYLDNCEKVKN